MRDDMDRECCNQVESLIRNGLGGSLWRPVRVDKSDPSRALVLSPSRSHLDSSLRVTVVIRWGDWGGWDNADHWKTVKMILGEDWICPPSVTIDQAAETAREVFETHNNEHWKLITEIMGAFKKGANLSAASDLARTQFKEVMEELECLRKEFEPVITIKTSYVAGEAQRCPVCRGSGKVPAGFYTRTDGSVVDN